MDVDVSSLSVGISDVSYVSSSVDENGVKSNSVAELGSIELESALSLTNSSTGDDSLLNVDVSSLSVGISDVSYVSSSVDENGVKSNSVAELGSIELESALSLTNSSTGDDSLLDVDVSSLSVGISDVSYASSSVDENGVESRSVAELGSIELESALSLTNSSNGNDSLLDVDVSSLSVGISDVSYASSSVDENGVKSNSVAELGSIELESALSLTNSSAGDDSLLGVDVSSLSVGISDVSYVSSSVDENGVESNSVAELGSIELESALSLTNSGTGDDSLLGVDVSSLSVGISDVSYVSSSIDENGVESNSVAELGGIELESALSLTNSSTGDDSLLDVDVSSLSVGISDVSYVSSSVDENGVESNSVAELGGIELESALSLTSSSTGDDSLLDVDVSSLSVGISDVSYASSSVDENGVESNSVAELGSIELESALSLTNSSTGDDSLLNVDVSSLSVDVGDVSYVSSSVDENGVESNSVAELGSIELESALSLTNSSTGDDSLLNVDVSSLSVGISDVSYVSSSVDENGVESNSVAELGSIELESALSLTNSSTGDDSLLNVDVSSLSVGISDVSYVSSSVDENGVESNSVAELGGIELESALSLTNSSTGDDSLLNVDVSSLSVGISDVSYASSSVDENGVESNSVAELGSIELESALSLTNSSTGDDSLLNVDVSSLSVDVGDVSYVSSSVDENGVESNSVAELGSIELESALSLTNSSTGDDSLLDVDVSSLSVGISDVSYVSSSVDENGVESNSVAELGGIELESALSLTNSSTGDDSLLNVDVSSLSVGISDVSYVSSSVDENGVESNSVAELGSIELESALSLTNSSNGDDSLLDVDVSSLSVGISDVSYVSSSVDENGVESNSVAELGSIELESALSLTNSSTGDDSLLNVDVSSLSVGISDVSYVSSSVDENGVESNSVAELGSIELESALSLTNSSTGDDSLLDVDVSSLSVGISDVSYASSSVDENGVESNSVAELGSIELESALSLTNSSTGDDSLLNVDVSSLSVGISDVSYVSSSVDENGVESRSVAELGSIELESALSLTNSSNGDDSLLNVDVSSLSVGISDVSYVSSSVDENGVESNSVAELGSIELESALSLTNSSLTNSRQFTQVICR